MSQLLRFRFFFICSLLIGSSTIYSCDKDTSISLGRADENIGVLTMDSMTVFTATHQLINLPTAGTGTVLVGKAQQENIGTVTASSYTRLLFESLSNDIPLNATFDSVNVVLKPNQDRYYYGDTTKTQQIAVHRVLEEIKTTDITTAIDNFNTPVYVTGPTIFSNQSFNYDKKALGTATFNPNIKSIDSISVKLDYNFGKDLFDKVVANDYNVNTNEALMQYLKGIVIVPNNNNTVVLGLSDSVYMNLNYSYIGSDGFKKTGSKSLSTASKTYQFNNISYDRTGTPFAQLNTENNRTLKNTETNGKVLIQAGAGVVAKLDIPSLEEFMNEKDIAINKIELVVETTGKNYGFYPNPSSMMLLIQNKNGVPVSYISSPFSNTIQSASLVAGNENGVNTSYTFNLIDYVTKVNTPAYKGTSLLLAAASPALFNTTNAAIIATENGKPKIKLNIVYTKFK